MDVHTFVSLKQAFDQLRHDQRKLLERLSKMPLKLRIKLQKAVDAQLYMDKNSALTQCGTYLFALYGGCIYVQLGQAVKLQPSS